MGCVLKVWEQGTNKETDRSERPSVSSQSKCCCSECVDSYKSFEGERFAVFVLMWTDLPLLLCGWPYFSLSLFHSFFSLFFPFPLSILFHDWQRAFLVNKAIFHLISTSFPSSSSTSLRVLPPSSPSLLPSTFLLLLSHLLGWWSNQCLNQTWAEC